MLVISWFLVAMLGGPQSMIVRWTQPSDVSNVDHYRISVDNGSFGTFETAGLTDNYTVTLNGYRPTQVDVYSVSPDTVLSVASTVYITAKPLRPELINWTDTLVVADKDTLYFTVKQLSMYEDSTYMDFSDLSFKVWIDDDPIWDNSYEFSLDTTGTIVPSTKELPAGLYMLTVRSIKNGVESESAYKKLFKVQ